MMVKQVTEVDVSVPFVLMFQEIAFSSLVVIPSPVMNAEQRCKKLMGVVQYVEGK
jgi:hypothetical protein